ncbi:MAG TPA: hypothetical protein DER60_07065 [Syntrophomonas sp.]|jgi:polyhydroxyalkanoate synthesis regulator phasin|nr:hypothetical protein [Syntrophomonas sp.]
MSYEETMNRSFEMAEKSIESFWDTWLLVLGSITWSQEQMDKMVQKYMEQKKVAREEAVKFVENLAMQAKTQQQQYGEVMKESASSFQIPGFTCMTDLFKRVEELSKKVDSL